VAALRRGGAVRGIREPVPGLSRARNTGIEAAAGDVIAFVDDDVVVQPGWLAAIAAGYGRPSTVAVCGPIDLAWPRPQPHWIGPELERFLSRLDYGDAPRLLVRPEAPFGANMSIRRDVVVELGGFSPELGRVDSSLISGEDFEFFLRLAGRGGDVLYQPSARVTHVVDVDRIALHWFVRRGFAQGRSNARLDAGRVPDAPRGRTAARAVAEAVARGWVRGAWHVAVAENRRAQAAWQLVRRAVAVGFAAERLRLARRPLPEFAHAACDPPGAARGDTGPDLGAPP
jgi:cellulose synthase/poly-beta-1,6-N-acetylglucosamine synthase-like glycosyltransferase